MLDEYEVVVNEDRKTGWFEHNEYGDESAGGLWFEDNKLVDYDGVMVLPKAVRAKLEEMGFVVDEDEFKLPY